MREIKIRVIVAIAIAIVLISAFALVASATAQPNNVISIGDGDVQAAPGASITTPILIDNTTSIAGIKINLSYNPAIVNVTDATLGDFDDSPHKLDLSNAKKGYIRIYVIKWSGLSGNKTVANVEFTAVGRASYDTSDLNISIISLKNDTGLAVTGSTKNGIFTIISEPTPIPSPTITEPPAPTEGVGGDERATPTPPGFEVLFTIAGLLAVAYLVLRREENKKYHAPFITYKRKRRW